MYLLLPHIKANKAKKPQIKGAYLPGKKKETTWEIILIRQCDTGCNTGL